MISTSFMINDNSWQTRDNDDSQDNRKTEIVFSSNETNFRGMSDFDFSNLVSGEDYAPDQVIVKLKSWTEPTSLLNANEISKDVEVLERTKTLGMELWGLEDISVEEAIALYSQDPNVEYVEPNYLFSFGAIPNDPSFSQLWGLHNTGQSGGTTDADIDAPEAWDIQTGNHNVVIGLMDSGLDYTHPDLAANVWTNPGEIPSNGLDDDNNGYVDDVHGYDFAFEDPYPEDNVHHGTHVAGTICAQGNNGEGVAGVNWNAQIAALKIGDTYGIYTFDAIQGLEYATMMKEDYGINIALTTNSWGGGGYSQALYDAIEASGEAGQLFIAAAGNYYGNNNDIYPFYPASYDLDNIISVAATDRYDNLSYFSNYGATSVDLGAPGSDIYSTIPGGGYASYNGTSMATPHVSGVAALLWAEYPDLTTAEVKQLLLETTDPIPALDGKTVSGGRLNAYNALIGGIAAKIEGSKWNDSDQDGFWDDGEQALGDWTIYLDLDNNGQFDPEEPSTTTDTDGNYAFNFLQPGTYTVAEVVEPGWTQTYPSSPGTYQVEVEAEEVVSGLNFGNFLSNPAEIQGSKWHDVDGDGIWDANESPLENWTIYLDQNGNGQLDEGDISTITDASGNYTFAGLAPDTYTVAEVQPVGWGQTYPGGSSIVFNDPYGDTFGYYDALDIESLSGLISGGNLNLTMDFFTPIAPPSSGSYNSVVGYWDLDLDQNVATGVPSNQSYWAPPDQQGGPLGVDVYIDLFSESSHPGLVNLVDTSTGTIGSAPITYSSDSFQVQIPLSLLGDDGIVNYGSVIGSFYEPTDAGPNTEFGTTSPSGTYTVELEPDEIATNIDFGNRLNKIQGSKWNDLNANGIWDAGEVGLADWTIYLDENQNGQLDSGETFTVTDADGNYTFSGLAPDTYTVAEVLKPGWEPTYPIATGGYAWSDSDDSGGPTFNWRDISGVGTQLYLYDDDYAEVTLPFTFSFYGEEKNTVKISSNGYLTFGSDAWQYYNESIPNPRQPNDFIAPFWDDLNPYMGGSIYYYHDTTEDQFIVQYQGVPHYYDDGSYTFEVILDSNGSILYQYDELNGILDSVTIGVENANGTEGLQVAYNQSYVHDDLAVSIVPFPSYTHTVTLNAGEVINDIDFGNHANIINGTNQQDILIGTVKNEILNGENGKDELYGMGGDDVLNGGNAKDILVGVNPDDDNPGRGEKDILNDGNGPDTFVLGDADHVYYDDGNPETQGLGDYGLIIGLAEPDEIQLKGTPDDYNLVEDFTVGSNTGTGIFVKDTIDELIGLVEGVTGLALNSNDFSFV